MKIKYTEKYYVSEDERTVVCILTLKYSYLLKFFNRALNVIGKNCKPEGNPSKNIYVPDEIKGFARCHPDDTFNVKEGKKIAREKAYLKAEKFREKFNSYMKNELSYLAENFDISAK